MDQNLITSGQCIIKNNTEEDYVIEELGGVILPPGIELDLLDGDFDTGPTSYYACMRLCYELPTAKLYQDIQKGDIVIPKGGVSPPKPIQHCRRPDA